MNCLNCGAPLTLLEGREHFRCPYCESLLFPDDLKSSIDRIKPLGEPSGRACPVCEIPLLTGAMDGRPVSYCHQCRGVLLSTDNFFSVVKHRREQLQGPVPQPRPVNQDEMKRKIHCPACRTRMEVHPYYGGGSVVIDSCRKCHEIWLDHGEMAVIERAAGRR